MDKQTRASVALFDIDGTLLDSSPLWADVPAQYLKDHGIEPQEDISSLFFKLGYSGTARHLAALYCPNVDPHAIMDDFCRIASVKYRGAVPEKPCACQYLRQLREKNVRSVVLTSNMKDVVLPALERLHITDTVEEILSIYDIGLDKRSPSLYHHMADRLGTTPQQCVVFEDALFAVKSAKSAGMQVVGIYDEYSRENWEALQREADRTIQSYGELLCDDIFP